MLMLEQLIEEIETMEDVQFTTIEAAASQWRKENPFQK